jgi:hypothetical protein
MDVTVVLPVLGAIVLGAAAALLGKALGKPAPVPVPVRTRRPQTRR